MKNRFLLIGFFYLLFLSVSGQVPTSGLVAYWPFSGNANDESGNGNNGTVNGATLTADRFGNGNKAYSFSGTGFISLESKPGLLPNTFTLSWWYKVNSYFGQRGVLSCVGGDGGYQQYFDGTNFAYLIGYNFPNYNSFFSSNYTVSNASGIWQNITVSYQKTGDYSSVTRIYFNGELKKTDNQGVAIAYPGGETFFIGKNHGGINFSGELDDIRLYNRLLTDSEILALFNETTVGINENDIKTNIVVSPNPTDGIVRVDLGAMCQNVQIKINDLAGTLIMKAEYVNSRIITLNLDKPSGIYIMTIVADNKRTSYKLLKN